METLGLDADSFVVGVCISFVVFYLIKGVGKSEKKCNHLYDLECQGYLLDENLKEVDVKRFKCVKCGHMREVVQDE